MYANNKHSFENGENARNCCPDLRENIYKHLYICIYILQSKTALRAHHVRISSSPTPKLYIYYPNSVAQTSISLHCRLQFTMFGLSLPNLLIKLMNIYQAIPLSLFRLHLRDSWFWIADTR